MRLRLSWGIRSYSTGQMLPLMYDVTRGDHAANYSFDRFDLASSRRFADMALQHRLGILPERWPWFSAADCCNSGPCKENLILRSGFNLTKRGRNGVGVVLRRAKHEDLLNGIAFSGQHDDSRSNIDC